MESSRQSTEPLLVNVQTRSNDVEDLFAAGNLHCKELTRVTVWELKNLWRLSWASVLIQVFNFMLSLVTQMFVGHLGATSLAGVSIANVGVQGLALGIMVFEEISQSKTRLSTDFFPCFWQLGMASAVQTLCGQAFGAKKYSIMGTVLQRAVFLHLVVAVALGFLYWFSGSFFRLIRQSEEVSVIGQEYSRGLTLQLIAYAIYLPTQRFLQAQNIVNPMAFLAIAVFFFHLLLSWVVMSVMKCGVLGASLSLSFSWWVLVVCTWVYILLSPSCVETWSGLSVKAFSRFWPYLKLTVASAVMLW